MTLYLASQSPRRRDILRQIGVDFEPVSVEVDETGLAGEAPGDYVTRLALAKARAGATVGVDGPVLGADTCVVLDGRVLGKPADRTEALEMLGLLSGRSHQVMSAVALVSATDCRTALSATEVSFRPLDRELLERYWDTGEPCDKAGAYGIQGLGAVFVDRIQGSYSGVVGLPIESLVPLLEVFGVPFWQGTAGDGHGQQQHS